MEVGGSRSQFVKGHLWCASGVAVLCQAEASCNLHVLDCELVHSRPQAHCDVVLCRIEASACLRVSDSDVFSVSDLE